MTGDFKMARTIELSGDHKTIDVSLSSALAQGGSSLTVPVIVPVIAVKDDSFYIQVRCTDGDYLSVTNLSISIQ